MRKPNSISAEMRDVRKNLYHTEADLKYSLARFGDKLAEEHGYDENGIEAVWLYLIRTHHWTSAVVRAMTPEDMQFALTVEMKGFTYADPK